MALVLKCGAVFDIAVAVAYSIVHIATNVWQVMVPSYRVINTTLYRVTEEWGMMI